MKTKKFMQFLKQHTTAVFSALALIICAGMLALATQWDLALDAFLYHPETPWAIGMEAFGWWVLFWPGVLWLLLKAAHARQNARRQSLAWLAGAVVLQLGLYVGSVHYLVGRALLEGMFHPKTWLCFMPVAFLFCLVARWAFLQKPLAMHKWQFFAICGSVYAICNLALVNLVKFIWQRPRFDEMLAEGRLSDFTAWYEPFGPGGSSFPSGHTASACGILMLLVLCDLFPALARHKVGISVFCWGYIVLMAFSRLVMGRHFLSDTVAAAGMESVLFLLFHQSAFYHRKLTQTNAFEERETKA